MSPKFFIGIDISKETLDYAVLQQNSVLAQDKIENSEPAIREFISKLKTNYKCGRANSFFCVESMGIYSTFLAKVCVKKKLKICMESALQIKRSLGIVRGKNDEMDAFRIAEYAAKNFHLLRLFQPPRKPIEELKTMSAIRKRLIKAKGMLSKSRKIETYFYTKANRKKYNVYSNASIRSIQEDIEKVELAMDEIIQADKRLTHLMEIVTSVPRIGKVIGMEIIIYTNEFQGIPTAKKFASYCGIAPFQWTSGTSVKGKTKVSHLANKELKALLHMAALGSMQNKTTFLAKYYERKVEEGKNKMSILNAIRNKIVHRIYSCVINDKPFVEINNFS